MFKVSVNTTLKQGTPSIKDEATYTPAKAIADAGYSSLRGMWMMDGQILTAADLRRPGRGPELRQDQRPADQRRQGRQRLNGGSNPVRLHAGRGFPIS